MSGPGNGEPRGPARMDCFIIYEVVDQQKENYTVTGGESRPVSMALATSPEEAVKMNADYIPGAFAKRAAECATEDVLRVGVVAIAGILAQMMMDSARAMQAVSAGAPGIDPRSVRARGQ